MCGAWEAETTREVPRERNMDLKSMQVNVTKSVKREVLTYELTKLS